MAPSAKSPTTYVKDVVLVFPGGILRSTGKLKPLRTSEAADSFCMLCPQCEDPTHVHQLYACDNGHKDMPPDTITSRGAEVGDVLVSLTGEEVTAARKVASNNTMELSVHPAREVEKNVLPTGIAYAFVPTAAVDPFYGVFAELARSKSVALVGKLVVRGKVKRFRLVPEPFGLALIELCAPEEVYAYEKMGTTPNPAHMKLARQLAAAARRPFDPEEYRDQTADRVAAIIEAKLNGETISPVVAITVTAEPEIDIIAALEASLAAVRAAAA